MSGLVDKLSAKWQERLSVDDLAEDLDDSDVRWWLRVIAEELEADGPDHYCEGEGRCDCSERAAAWLRQEAENER